MSLRMSVNLTTSMKIYKRGLHLPTGVALEQGPLPPKDLICTRREDPGAPHHLTPTFKALPALACPHPHSVPQPSPLSVSHLRALCQAGPSSVFKALVDTPHFQSPPHPLRHTGSHGICLQGRPGAPLEGPSQVLSAQASIEERMNKGTAMQTPHLPAPCLSRPKAQGGYAM